MPRLLAPSTHLEQYYFINACSDPILMQLSRANPTPFYEIFFLALRDELVLRVDLGVLSTKEFVGLEHSVAANLTAKRFVDRTLLPPMGSRTSISRPTLQNLAALTVPTLSSSRITLCCQLHSKSAFLLIKKFLSRKHEPHS